MPPLMLSTSQRSSFKRCPWSWQWSYMKRLEPKTSAPALRFGSLIHVALEKFYPIGIKRGPHPSKTFVKAYDIELRDQSKMGFRDEDGTWHDARDLGVAMLDNYIDKYGDDEEWRVIATEHKFTYPILEKGRQVATFVGVLDGIWQSRINKRLMFVDHKTASSISTEHLFIDDQAGGYWTYGVDWAYENGLLKPKQQLAGIMFNFLLKSPPDPRPTDELGRALNKDGTVSKNQPAARFLRYMSLRDEYDRESMKARTAEEVKLIKLVEGGKLGILKSPSAMNCRMCSVRDLCELHEVGGDWEEYARMTMKPKTKPIRQEAIEADHAH